MLQILNSTWDFLTGLIASVWGMIVLLGAWVWEVLYQLHIEMPRLEGLLVGVLLTWLLLKRDKHPIIRALSAPLKIVLDILDIIWDETWDVVTDLWRTGKDAVVGVVSKVLGKVKDAWNWGIDSLKSIREKLSRKTDES
jgi:hypothetical protein